MDAEKTLVTAEGSGGSAPAPNQTRPQVTFMGNSYDLMAVVSAVLGGLMVLSCFTCNFGYYCVPPVALVLGLVGLISTKDAVDADRTRLLSWLGVIGGGLVLLLIVLGIVAYVGLIILAVALGGSSSRGS